MVKHGRWPIQLVVGLAALALVAAACGEEEGAGGGEGGGTTVQVDLTDFSIAPDVSSVAPGSVTFVAENVGPSEHELVVLKTDIAPDALPVEGGAVEEEASGIEEIGEIEEFEAGGEESATFDLASGSYVLICNIAGHYEQGMTVAFQVT